MAIDGYSIFIQCQTCGRMFGPHRSAGAAQTQAKYHECGVTPREIHPYKEVVRYFPGGPREDA